MYEERTSGVKKGRLKALDAATQIITYKRPGFGRPLLAVVLP
jgi:hypothetical protein